MMRWVFILAIFFPNNGHVTVTGAEFAASGECEWVKQRAEERFGAKIALAECRPFGGKP